MIKRLNNIFKIRTRVAVLEHPCDIAYIVKYKRWYHLQWKPVLDCMKLWPASFSTISEALYVSSHIEEFLDSNNGIYLRD